MGQVVVGIYGRKPLFMDVGHGEVRRYTPGDTIELTVVPGVKVAVNDIFSEQQI